MRVIHEATEIKAAGQPVKSIFEFVGNLNTTTDEVSIAKMISPQGWSEPGQTPDFNEYTVVLAGVLVIETRAQKADIKKGEAIMIEKGEWVKYSTPYENGAEYIAVCLPAFSPERVHRDNH